MNIVFNIKRIVSIIAIDRYGVFIGRWDRWPYGNGCWIPVILRNDLWKKYL